MIFGKSKGKKSKGKSVLKKKVGQVDLDRAKSKAIGHAKAARESLDGVKGKAGAAAQTARARAGEAAKIARKAAESKAASTGGGGRRGSKNGKEVVAEGYDGVYAIMFQRLRGWLAKSALRYSIMANIALSIVVVALGISLALLANQPPPKPVYFATNPDGTVAKLIPLSKPIGTKSAVLNWAQQVATECYTFSFTDMERKVLQCENGYFTNQGAARYRKALAAAKLFEDVKNRELFHVASLRGPALIAKTGKIKKRLAYVIKVPIYIKLSGPRTRETVVERTVTMMAVRVPTLDKPSGLAVHQFVVE